MNIVITGASRGIGKAIAEAFATEGNTLFLCARNKKALEETASELMKKNTGCKAETMVADLSEKKFADAFGDWCLTHAVPDILVNNTGGYVPGNLLDEAEGNLENMLNTNLYSAYHLTRKIAPEMVKKGSGHIFNICSVASLAAYEGGGSYSISKFAMHGLNQNLRHELKTKGIKVTGVYPGAVLTDSWGNYDNSSKRIMEATDVAAMILACTKLSAQAVPEEIILRPQLGDL